MSDSDITHEEKKHPVTALLFLLFVLGVIAGVLFQQNAELRNNKPYDEFNLMEALGLASKSPFDVEKIAAVRVIGDTRSPVKITEYSSYTCGACGVYHRDTYDKIKKEYIDTGKAYLEFNNIPRNVEDVSISTIARCIPEKAYFTFLDLIFETQKEWMSAKDPVAQVKEKAVVAGVPSETIDECFKSAELRKELVKNAKNALAGSGVKQAPTLVINGTQKIMGLDDYENIRDAIEVELAKAEADEKAKKISPEEMLKQKDNADTSNVTDQGSADDEEDELDIEVVDPSTQDIPEPEALTNIESSAGEEATVSEDGLDIEALAKPRILGNPEAPIKISDYSSYTCGACAGFHLEAFEKLKEEYIDTGKAYLVYDDFPRNGTDIKIGAIARCIPDDAYFRFVELVFKTQNIWMRDKDPLSFIKQNAALTGADPELIDKCAESEALYEALVKRRQVAYEELEVNSTPTFIINGKERLVGNVPYAQFRKTLDTELKKAK